MRRYSTPASAVNGEITQLAILECFAAVALYVCIGLYSHTFAHLTFAIAVAPLMLLRTDISADWGLRTWGRLFASIDNLPSFAVVPVFVVLGPFIGLGIRILGTLYWAIRYPLYTLKNVPQNWLRQTLCTDLLHPPEILPLEALEDDRDDIPTFAKMVKAIREDTDRWVGAHILLLVSPFLIVGYLPSVLYRVSFKATSIAYAPFVWAAHSTLGEALSLKDRLKRITTGEFEWARRGFSWLVLTALATKLALGLGWVDLSYVADKFPSQRFVDSIMVPSDWPWWQVTLGVDAMLTFFLLYFADAAAARLEGVWREHIVSTVVSMTSFLRATLAVITVSYFCYVAVVTALSSPLRSLGSYMSGG